jgi:hypothetical protein
MYCLTWYSTLSVCCSCSHSIHVKTKDQRLDQVIPTIGKNGAVFSTTCLILELMLVFSHLTLAHWDKRWALEEFLLINIWFLSGYSKGTLARWLIVLEFQIHMLYMYVSMCACVYIYKIFILSHICKREREMT